MSLKDLAKRKEYRHQYYLKHRVLHGYHINSGSFKKGFKFVNGIREKMGLDRRGISLSVETRLKISIARKGWKPSKETREKFRLANLGRKQSIETIEKRRQANKGQKRSEEFKRRASERTKGEKHPRWIKDRTLVIKNRHGDAEYAQWRMRVWNRDNFKCKILNDSCKGRIEAHHILVWRDYPELRYIINNGITLCHAHHPRKRALEIELAPIFRELIKE